MKQQVKLKINKMKCLSGENGTAILSESDSLGGSSFEGELSVSEEDIENLSEGRYLRRGWRRS